MKSLFRKKQLILRKRRQMLDYVVLGGNKTEKTGSLLLHEMTADSFRQKMAEILGVRPLRLKSSVPETLLILPRREVIQKIHSCPQSDTAVWREHLRNEVRQSLPYALKELAYGLSVTPKADRTRTLLTVIPEVALKDHVRLFENAGLRPDEIVTEDQPLCWLMSTKRQFTEGPCLLLDRDNERCLSILTQDGKLVSSRILEMPDDPATFRDHLQELSLSMVETGDVAERIGLTGNWGPDDLYVLRRHFTKPCELFFGSNRGGETPDAILQGARFRPRDETMSLLPSAWKAQRQRRMVKKQWRNLAAGIILFAGMVSLGFQVQLIQMEKQTQIVQKSLDGNRPDIEAAKRRLQHLGTLQMNFQVKMRVLDMMKQMGQNFSEGVELRNLVFESGKIVLEGESSSHARLMEVLRVIEDYPGIENAKLIRTRLRKRQNREYFEFELTAKWKEQWGFQYAGL